MSAYLDALLRAAILKVLTEINDEHRDEIRDSLEPGDRKTIWHDGQKVGQVLRTDPAKRWTVIDHDAFGRWVGEHCPEAIITTTAVNPAWRAQVLKAGRVEVVDPETGEVTEQTPDGVVLVAGASQLQVRPNDVAERIALSMLGTLREVTSGE